MEEVQRDSISNLNRSRQSSLKTQDISTAVFISYCFQCLHCQACLLPIPPLLYFLSFLLLNPSLYDELAQDMLFVNSVPHNFLCFSQQTGADCIMCKHVITVQLRWGSEESKRQKIDNMHKDIWLKRLMGLLFRRVCPPTCAWITLNSAHTNIHTLLLTSRPALTFLNFNSQPEDRSFP